jgi:cell wall-associated NlpC family hydrolase
MTAKVYFNSQYQKYHARIYIGKGKYKHVGRYESEQEALNKTNTAIETILNSKVQAPQDVWNERARLSRLSLLNKY